MEPASDEDPETQIVQIPEITQEYFDDNEFIDTKEALDNERIIELVKNLVVNDNEPDDFVDEESKITFIEAKKTLINLVLFASNS
ncbi:14400_t:CDS:2 [Gigaspora margarita]|uniref:14400_t:CDS:1 n=1 Tax=Gigaspora margarita TaxID=4874 RepID=A0ABN7WAN5_GIGMA|nr:14400_t:CDS:2 [Gigaspora margarita]